LRWAENKGQSRENIELAVKGAIAMTYQKLRAERMIALSVWFHGEPDKEGYDTSENMGPSPASHEAVLKTSGEYSSKKKSAEEDEVDMVIVHLYSGAPQSYYIALPRALPPNAKFEMLRSETNKRIPYLHRSDRRNFQHVQEGVAGPTVDSGAALNGLLGRSRVAGQDLVLRGALL
jgi:hypothetical protein